MKIEKLLPIFILLILAISIVYISFFSVPKKIPVINNNFSLTPECSLGDKKNCTTSLGCHGFIYCTNSGWGDCTLSKVCTPYTRLACWDGCFKGYKTCNECGTNYSGCIPESPA